ncbi:ATP-binding protein [Oribacterium sp. WCC10]|uniref:ATP-binding protein n=1 Tax=Oribacterium sp. WCC10 TaxID=1855343 RepID=UPI0008EE7409|nr:ATP-binding protein [Oribacterium sp. WCC10]SFG79900.1 Signal transduction histidine kinase [Oribacterium sp. WCC10]
MDTYKDTTLKRHKTEPDILDITKIDWKYKLLAFIGIITTCFLLVTGVAIFHDYRNTLMKNQQDQLLLMAKTLSRNMSADMDNYIRELGFFSSIVGDDSNDAILKEYLDMELDCAVNVFIEDSAGQILKSALPMNIAYAEVSEGEDASIGDMTLYGLQKISDVGNGITIWQGKRAEGNVLVFKKRLSSEIIFDTDGVAIMPVYVGFVIDEDRYYEDVVADTHIGTNGYIVVKNSGNLMLMHPSKEQWGIKVISGRMEMFPDLDYQSLERLLEKQNHGEEGVADYYSYWWMEEGVPRVRKISGYSPVKIGEDFWIVSAVVDYDDYYKPILEGFQGIILVSLGILLVFIFAFVGIFKLIFVNNRASREINYLKNLNEVLEEMHRSENAIAHQQRLQIMGTMTGGIAHEFNNFLTPIMGHAELLMMSLPEDSDEYDSAKEILLASEKAKDVVHQMSAMSRKNVETVFRNLDAEKLVNRFFRMAESICPENVEVRKQKNVEEEYILGNSTQINQVLLNITVNGIQAMRERENGILGLKAYTMNQTDIKIKEMSKDSLFKKYLVFEISDNGTGMSKKVRKQIFEPFYTTKKPGEGTGLGLSLAEQIVEEHKGIIHIDTEIGKGTTFYVYFPVVEVQNAASAEHDEINVIVVDDNHKILSLLKDGLNARPSINAVMCDSAESLHDALKDMTPDIVLIDESVGNNSGIEIFMSELNDNSTALKMIMADAIDREIVDAKKRGLINGYMEKPVSEAEIIKLAEQIVRNITNLNEL